MFRIYRHAADGPLESEECYYFDTVEPLFTDPRIQFLLAEPHTALSEESKLQGNVVEIGPRLEIETPFSSEAVQICKTVGINVTRIERSMRYVVPDAESAHYTVAEMDHLTEMVYETPLSSFATGKIRAALEYIDILTGGEDTLRAANERYGLGMDAWDITHWTAVFQRLGFNPSDAALLHLGNANSEHSRHWFWQGIHEIEGITVPESLMDLAKTPWKRNPGITRTAFRDNAGVMRGHSVEVLLPRKPGVPSSYERRWASVEISATAETHNHPTMVEPFAGAATGTGGRIRDNRAVGRGGLVHAGTAAYCVGLLHIPGYHIPGESEGPVSDRYASPLRILIEGSNGISRYNNEIGEPLIGGFCRSFGQNVGGSWLEYVKPILYSGGLGRVFDGHVAKHAPKTGMHVVQPGGPMYPIGVGGGSASSLGGGSSSLELDRKSVQRGNAEYENRANRVIQTCAEMLDGNPIQSIHDQGAGGPANVLTELAEPAGAKIDIAKITLGDTTMSFAEAWVAEAQERYGVLIAPEDLERFKAICERERVNCDVAGEITGDGRITVWDSRDGSVPVDLPLADFLSELPRKRFTTERITRKLMPLTVPSDLTVRAALEMTLKQLAVCSKAFKLRKSDRSVTGLVALQPCVGPKHLPVANAGVTAHSYFGYTGAATAIGENPNRLLIDAAAGTRMIFWEMLSNLACVRISNLEDIACRLNWMWPAKLRGEAAFIFEAARTACETMIALGIRGDGGKDSSSLSAKVGDQVVPSPGSLVVKGYAPVPDIHDIVTPDLMGDGVIGFLDLGDGLNRLGGSAFAQALGQLGNVCPDIEPDLMGRAFDALQTMIAEGCITAYHDRSDGGLITALVEMCIAGNRGARINLRQHEDILAHLFSEEAGMLFEIPDAHFTRVSEILDEYQLDTYTRMLGRSGKEFGGSLMIAHAGETVLEESIVTLRQWWEATSDELEKQQTNPATLAQEVRSYVDTRLPMYWAPALPLLRASSRKPKVAILREEGSNGDREMAAAMMEAECEPHDVAMSDIVDGRVTSLAAYDGLALVGGFSFADTFGSAKGWAASILFEPRIRKMFDAFYERKNTFSLGVCNGCQLMALLGWLPHRGLPEASQPRLLANTSGRFESRFPTVRIMPSPSIFLTGMEDAVIGVHVAHGEGRFFFPDESVAKEVQQKSLAPIVYVDSTGRSTEEYPYNPNGSPGGIAALCSEDGRHLAMMPHPERCFLTWQMPYLPSALGLTKNSRYSPWMRLFRNARDWSLQQ